MAWNLLSCISCLPDLLIHKFLISCLNEPVLFTPLAHRLERYCNFIQMFFTLKRGLMLTFVWPFGTFKLTQGLSCLVNALTPLEYNLLLLYVLSYLLPLFDWLSWLGEFVERSTMLCCFSRKTLVFLKRQPWVSLTDVTLLVGFHK